MFGHKEQLVTWSFTACWPPQLMPSDAQVQHMQQLVAAMDLNAGMLPIGDDQLVPTIIHATYMHVLDKRPQEASSVSCQTPLPTPCCGAFMSWPLSKRSTRMPRYDLGMVVDHALLHFNTHLQ